MSSTIDFGLVCAWHKFKFGVSFCVFISDRNCYESRMTYMKNKAASTSIITVAHSFDRYILSGIFYQEHFLGIFCLGIFCLGMFCLGMFCLGMFCWEYFVGNILSGTFCRDTKTGAPSRRGHGNDAPPG